ncbi:MAG: hypothetical protein QM775_05910 [Pirellulales bacterium]
MLLTPNAKTLLIVFTAQNDPKLPRQTHTWGVLLHCYDGQVAASETISWLPTTGVIEPRRLNVEPGRNFSHAATLEWCRSIGIGRVSAWGPIEVHPSVARKFHDQRRCLESGAAGYQCLDFLGECGLRHTGYNCVTALDEIIGPTPTDLLHSYGDASGALIVGELLRRGWGRVAPAEDDAMVAAAGYFASPKGPPLVRRPTVLCGVGQATGYGALH